MRLSRLFANFYHVLRNISEHSFMEKRNFVRGKEISRGEMN